jgi:anti-sigma regulatory factor (Ser/Thr protein kinase)
VTAPSPHPTPALGQALGGPASVSLAVTEQGHVGEARRRAVALGITAGLTETERGTLAVVVTEAATNLARHATQGLVLLRVVGTPPSGVEVLALDKGPGIRDLTRAMSDGFSTAGSAGNGLGAIRRMANEFDLFSMPETGTALFARVDAAARSTEAELERAATGVVCLPMATERACGDAWLIDRTRHRTLVALADGLGHGFDAARAAGVAIHIAVERARHSPAQIIQAAHTVMGSTRGAAVAVAEIVPSEHRVTFAGIGNIAAAIVSPQDTNSLASHNGIVGHEMRTVREFVYPWTDAACLIMHSDGIRTRWQLGAYPGLAAHHPALVAGTLFRDFTRGRDDATVLAVRVRER